jgi:hypothetical protein
MAIWSLGKLRALQQSPVSDGDSQMTPSAYVSEYLAAFDKTGGVA